MIEIILYHVALIVLNGTCAIGAYFFMLQFLELKKEYADKKMKLCIIFYLISLFIQIPNTLAIDTSFPIITPIYFIFQIAFICKVVDGKALYKIILFVCDKLLDILETLIYYVIVGRLVYEGIDVFTALPTFSGNESFKLIYIILNAIFLFPFKISMAKLIKLIIKYCKKLRNISFVLIPLSSVALFFSFYFASRVNETSITGEMPLAVYMATIGGALAVVGYILMFFSYNDIQKKTILEQQLYYADKNQKELFRSIDILAESQKQQNMLNHDYKNQLIAVSMLLKDNEIEKAQNFIDGLLGAVDESKKTTYCINPIVNATLNYKAAVAKEKNIKFDTDIIIPEDIPELSEMDLCSVFSNPIDNAIEANEKLSENDRYLSIKARCDKTMLVIEVQNPVITSPDTPKGVLPMTTKEDKKNHGLGLSILHKIATESGGIVNFECENNIAKLYIRIILDN